MSFFSEFFGGGGGGGRLRYQDFPTSGTFTPSAILQANGGPCVVVLVGGGGGGGGSTAGLGAGGGGGGGGAVRIQPLRMTTGQAVTIRGGGASVKAGRAASIRRA